MRLDRTLFTSTQYPADYGYIEDTLGEDGDPLDALVLLHGDPLFPGVLVRCRAIGMFRMTDEKGGDDKVLCRAGHRPAAGAPARHPPRARVRPAGDPALLRGLQGTRARQERRGSAPGSAASTPRQEIERVPASDSTSRQHGGRRVILTGAHASTAVLDRHGADRPVARGNRARSRVVAGEAVGRRRARPGRSRRAGRADPTAARRPARPGPGRVHDRIAFAPPDGQVLVAERERRLRRRRQPDPAAQQGTDDLAGLGGGDELRGREGQHPPVQQPGRAAPARSRRTGPRRRGCTPRPDRGALSCSAAATVAAAQRAARVVLAVRADEVDRVRRRLARRPVQRQLQQLGLGRRSCPQRADSSTVPAVDQRPPADRAPPASGRVGGSPVPGSGAPRHARRPPRRQRGRSGRRAGRRGPTGPGCSTSSSRPPGRPCRASGRRAAARVTRIDRAISRGCGWLAGWPPPARRHARPARATPSRSSRRDQTSCSSASSPGSRCRREDLAGEHGLDGIASCRGGQLDGPVEQPSCRSRRRSARAGSRSPGRSRSAVSGPSASAAAQLGQRRRSAPARVCATSRRPIAPATASTRPSRPLIRAAAARRPVGGQLRGARTSGSAEIDAHRQRRAQLRVVLRRRASKLLDEVVAASPGARRRSGGWTISPRASAECR